jgi:hypothetical protein
MFILFPGREPKSKDQELFRKAKYITHAVTQAAGLRVDRCYFDLSGVQSTDFSRASFSMERTQQKLELYTEPCDGMLEICDALTRAHSPPELARPRSAIYNPYSNSRRIGVVG